MTLGEGDVRIVDYGALDPGDIDGTGTVDRRDLRLVARQPGRGVGSNGADVDDDGDVDISDVSLVARSFGLVGPSKWPSLEA